MHGGRLNLCGGCSNTQIYGELNGDVNSQITNSSGPATLTLYQGGDYEGQITDSQGKTISLQTYDGTLTLGHANTYQGGTTINSGTVKLGNSSALGTGAVSVNGTLDLAGYSPTINGLSGGGHIGNSSTSSNSVLTISGGGTFNGAISDTLGSGAKTTALTVSGGTLTLGGNNTYTGATVLGDTSGHSGTLSYMGITAAIYTGSITVYGGSEIDTYFGGRTLDHNRPCSFRGRNADHWRSRQHNDFRCHLGRRQLDQDRQRHFDIKRQQYLYGRNYGQSGNAQCI